jgi:Xaa-Pro aminopeptidase
MLTRNGCLQRQARLRTYLAENNVDAVLLTNLADIFYFTGTLLSDLPFLSETSSCVVLETAGGSWAVVPEGDELDIVDDVLTYAWSRFGTLEFDQRLRLNACLESKLSAVRGWKRIGYQAESLAAVLERTVSERFSNVEWFAVDDIVLDLQSVKDDDEVACLREVIRANLGSYDAVRAAIAPGVTELEILAAGRRGAMLTAGAKVMHDGDYRCGAENGPARNRPIEDGELYIVDAWTYHGGYWSDLSRTFAVGSTPTDLQQSIYDHIAEVQQRVPTLLGPGKDGREVFKEMDALIREHPALADTGLQHHGGHGVGVHVHGLPDLNRDRGGILRPGNVVSVEPAGYHAEARYGVRLENTYLIGRDGAELLSEYPMEMVACR